MKQLPGTKYEPRQDLRICSWNLTFKLPSNSGIEGGASGAMAGERGGLDYQDARDQQAVAIAAQALWICQPDLIVLTGLGGPSAASKVIQTDRARRP